MPIVNETRCVADAQPSRPPPADPPLVEVRDLTKRFHKGGAVITALEKAQLMIQPTEFVALTGASGTGKSTLLNLLAGIDRPDSGTILVDGVDLTGLSRGKLADWRAKHLGYVFQTPNLIPVLTAYENVELPLQLLSMRASQRRQRVQLALELVGLTDRADHYPRQLSGGQEQRVGIARAIATGPRLVVADEPTGSLDDEASEQIKTLLQRLSREMNVTLLMVTHDATVAAIADRVVRLEKGRISEVK